MHTDDDNTSNKETKTAVTYTSYIIMMNSNQYTKYM